MRRSLFKLVSVALLACAFLLAAGQNVGGVSKAMLRQFSRGVNVTRWFCYQPNYSDPSHLTDYLGPEDFENFKRLKITFVRLCLAPEAVYADGRLNLRIAPYLDLAIDKLTSRGLGVIFDLHDNGQLKLDAPAHDNSGFLSFWKNAAAHYLRKYEKNVVFELANEPQFPNNPADWYALQRKAVEAIRKIDPERTVMVSGTGYSSIDTLVKMQPLEQKNLIYTYHCYDPFFFTHQGASWVGDQPKLFKNIPFPSSPEAVQPILSGIPAQFQASVKWYGEQHFDGKYLHDRISKAVDWARSNGVPAVLGEFGAYPPVSPPASRGRWFRAMAEVFADLHVPNCLWGYDDALGLGREVTKEHQVKLDEVVLENLYPDRLKK